MKTASEIREIFLQYFEDRSHRRVRSSSLVPRDDPTLLFTNAGMNQFKDVFLGLEKRDYVRAASSQKCMRVSGKHNDLETVGRTPRHHTFFEMLGNFSFGDYFKKEAIEFAWELVTDVFAIDSQRIVATVYRQDDEAYRIWREGIGLEESRVFRLGEKDNFWAMGDTGPCGPCSELHFDLTGQGGGDPETNPERFLEIWNLVFMQFNRDDQGRQSDLPSPSIDTGMGLERIACVVQGLESNYDTDLFKPIIDSAYRLTGTPYGRDEAGDTGLRILADHSRACAFLVADGVIPGNEGRGYVLRKILRRAIRHGKALGCDRPFIFELTSQVADLMSSAYPELEESREYVSKIVRNEEEKFSETLEHGLSRLEEICRRVRARDQSVLPGDELFRLYDTYGFPLDLARDIAQERGFSLDEAGFQEEMEEQRRRARASWSGGAKKLTPVHQALSEQGHQTEFTGYQEISQVEGKVLALIREGRQERILEEGQQGEMVLDRSPFYAEAGGQVGDRGSAETETAQVSVENTFSPVAGLRLHSLRVVRGRLALGDRLNCSVAADRRVAIMRNHTATHLFHAALREVLGHHVKQAGSLVAPERLRFDFTHYKSVTPLELREIEELVNLKIRDDIEVQTEISDLDEAIKRGAMALFGEKYSQKVRVVDIPGFSLELCGGTHVGRTGQIGSFRIVGESSISAGVRRVEALSGEKALERFLEADDLVERVSSDLHVQREQLSEAVRRISTDLKDAAKRIEELQLKLAQVESRDAVGHAREVNGIKVLAQRVDRLDRGALRQLADRLRNQLGSGVVVLGTPAEGKVSLVAMVSADLTDRIRAGDLIRDVAPLVQGGGGGKPQMAEAGGKDPDGLPGALERVYGFVSEKSA